MRLLSAQLQAFMAIVQYKTVHTAAQALYLTQTAVTQRIRALEKRLSTSLFVRSRRGMALTTEGEALLRYCQQVLELEGEALSAIVGASHEKNISVCITGPTTLLHVRILPQLYQVIKKFPRLLLNYEVNDREERVQLLRAGVAQLAIITPTTLADEMEYKQLKPENYVLVAPSKWKNRPLKKIIQEERIIDFNIHDQMTFNYLKFYNLFEYANTERHFINRTDSLAAMIIAELGYSVLPLEFVKSILSKNEIIILNAGKIFPMEYVLAWYPRHQQPAYFKALIAACK